jgi:hypothetical protein
MTKTKRPKLALKSETIRALTSVELEGAGGGRDLEPSRERICYTSFGPGQRCF